jgi:hypothetical protein
MLDDKSMHVIHGSLLYLYCLKVDGRIKTAELNFVGTIFRDNISVANLSFGTRICERQQQI